MEIVFTCENYVQVDALTVVYFTMIYLVWLPGGGGGTPIHYLYGYVPPNGIVILKLLI